MRLLVLLLLLSALPAFAQKKDSAYRPRPGMGLFYMSGPRAYGSKGFLGVQGQLPFAKGKWMSAVGAGGYYNKSDDTDPSIYINFPTGLGLDTRPHILATTTRGYLVQGSAEYSFRLGKRLMVGAGLQAGYAYIFQTVEYDTYPQYVQPDSTYTNPGDAWVYYHQRDLFQQRTYFAAPAVAVSYTACRNLTFSLRFSAGPSYVSRSVSRFYTEYALFGYTAKQAADGSFDFSGLKSYKSETGTYDVGTLNHSGSYNKFDLFGYSCITLGATYIFPAHS